MDNIKNYFDSGEEGVYGFLAACDSMLETKFVLSERKITELLELIAASTVLHKIVGGACKGFDFPAQLASATIKMGQTTSLLVPMGRNEQIAFAVNLLYAFDVDGMLFRQFLEEYYYSGNGLNFAFTSFVRNIILPLRRNIESAYREYMTSALVSCNQPISEVQLADVRAAIYELIRQLPQEDGVIPQVKGEMLQFLEGVQAAIESDRLKLARTMASGLKNIMIGENVSRYFSEMEAHLDAALAV